MKTLKIVIAGNSVALRVRPPKKHPNNNNYSTILQYQLEDELNPLNIEVRNRAKGALLIKHLLSDIDTLVQEFPNYYILNIGVVDASTREISYWAYKHTDKKVKNVFDFIISALYAKIIARNRPIFVKLRRKKSWISINDFNKYFDQLISYLLKESNARIITLSINPANERVETLLPGSRKNHLHFNEILKTITLKYGQIFIDTTSFIFADDYPDGVHFSSRGHKKIASKLKEIIIDDIKKLQLFNNI